MPVTAKLSRKFYETFGDDVATEFVDWFNSVDATYRADLRDLNELNFARFDAKVEQRMAQLEAKLEQRMVRLEAKLEQRMAQLEAKLEQRMAQLESRLDRSVAELRLDLAALEARLDARFVAFEGRLVGRLEARVAEARSGLLRWMFAGWTTLVLMMLGTLFAVIRAG